MNMLLFVIEESRRGIGRLERRNAVTINVMILG